MKNKNERTSCELFERPSQEMYIIPRTQRDGARSTIDAAILNSYATLLICIYDTILCLLLLLDAQLIKYCERGPFASRN